MSNPYAPPEDGRRPDADPPDAHGRPAPQQNPQHYPSHQHLAQQHPGQHPGQAPVPPPIPTDPEGAAQARRHARTFGLLLLASAILGTLHVPWQALALPFIVGAVVYGIRAALTASRAHVRGALVPMLIVGIAISAVWAMVAGGMLLLWPLQAERQACLADALTHTARAQCEQDFRQGLEDWQDKLRTRTAS